MTAALAAAVLVAVAPAAEEPRAPASPEAIVAYHDSGAWEADTSAAIDRARAFLDERLEAGAIGRPAIVLDVDDTSLSSYACLKRAGFDRDRAGDACAAAGDMPAIPQTRALFRHARARRVAVVFVTGRRERLRRATVANLRSEGYRGRSRLRMRPDGQPRSRRAGWKARVRRSLVRRGLRIVVNVGDQRSDLTGGFALATFKLPNPMYVIPVA